MLIGGLQISFYGVLPSVTILRKKQLNIMINKWNYQPLTHQQKEQAETLLPVCGGQKAVAELLIRRGVT